MSIPQPAGTRVMAGISCCSFGELLQGVLAEDNVDFLVTLPIQKYSVSYFVSDQDRTDIVTCPDSRTKSAALAKLILEKHGVKAGGTLYINCDIADGKGLSSSSADLLATARALEVFLGKEIPLSELCGYMSGIEPTDGVMYAESVVYLQRQGRLWSRLGRLSDVQIVSLDEGGTVDTLEYHRRSSAQLHKQQYYAEFNELLQRIIAAFRDWDLEEIGRVSTRSAYINQSINPKCHLDMVHEVCRETGGLGLVTSHSGTCLGILYDVRRLDHKANLDKAVALLSSCGQVSVYDAVK